MPLTPPNVDSATNTGMVHAMKPYIRCANVYNIHTMLRDTRFVNADDVCYNSHTCLGVMTILPGESWFLSKVFLSVHPV